MQIQAVGAGNGDITDIARQKDREMRAVPVFNFRQESDAPKESEAEMSTMQWLLLGLLIAVGAALYKWYVNR